MGFSSGLGSFAHCPSRDQVFDILFFDDKGTETGLGAGAHTNPLTDTILIISIVFHALYGLRTVIIDLGVKKEKLLFWVFTISGVVSSAILLIIYFTRNY
ncbi:MAG: hypothetical protein GQ545_08870 [Candidatus Aminicenantes bacterium]|nr:hypothetical protein [Candidatus Aminicenantes bacterium]